MKKLLLLSTLLILALGSYAQQGNWVAQPTNFSTASSGVRQIFVVDTNVAWVVPYDGTGTNLPRQDYSKTTDGGATWVTGQVPVSTDFEWSNICALNADTAWALMFQSVTNGGQIWKTTNGGTTWTRQGVNLYPDVVGSTSFPDNIYFWDANNGLVVGDQVNGEYECYTTTDGGTTWTPVDSANIPNPQDADENAWTTHFQVIGDTVWFDTNEGRIYRSVDRGIHWTVAHSTITISPLNTPQEALDICFTSGSYGIARFYVDGTMTNTLVRTTDGGLNWDTIPYTGDLFGADIKNIPGEPMSIISTGISPSTTGSGYTGTSYSNDGGSTWTTIETGTQRGALGIADSLHMWCGGFSSATGGVYKWTYYPTVLCTDSTITTGTVTANRYDICDGDTLVLTTSGSVGPEDGYYSGIGWAISSADISGSTSPLTELSLVATQRVVLPASSVNNQLFVNDATLIDGSTLPYGVYYWTPVFFGNAANSDTHADVAFLSDLTLDPNCTYSGSSVAIHVYAPNDPLCGSSVSELDRKNLSVNSFMKDRNTMEITITSFSTGKANIQVMDLTGRIVETINTVVNSGSNQQLINVEKLATGTYLIKAQVNGHQAANKIVKM